MPLKDKKDYQYETARLEETIDYVGKMISTVEKNQQKFEDDIKDAYINLDYLDSSSSYATIMLNTTLLEALEKNFDQLLLARKKPYFARMDVKQDNKDHKEELYIGKISLFDAGMETPLVVDWRAPIASIYYDGRLGRASYSVDGVNHEVELYLKRQYTIGDGRLLDYMDVDISVSDTFLQASLEANAGDKLKDIVSTIQAEQNAIIRADIHKPLIVQGVAGSGKTTIALHRIAYLIYTYSETFQPHHFMIMAPNNLFLDYISQVLPELGADKVKQTTYVNFMLEVIGKKYRFTDGNSKLAELTEHSSDKEALHLKDLMRKAARFKSSIKMKSIMNRYMEDIKMSIVPEIDFMIGDQLIFEHSMIHKMFHEDFSFLPLHRRISQIKLFLNKRAKEETTRLLEETSDYYNRAIQKTRDYEDESEERRLKIVSLIEQRDARLETIRRSGKIAASKYMDLYPKEDLNGYYRKIITDPGLLAHYSDLAESPEVYQYISENAERLYGEKRLEMEDLAPLAYLKKGLFGLDSIDIRYVVIDEAQDFSEFQFHVLKEILETDRFTVLGDLSQGIHMYRAIENWDFLKGQVFESAVNYLELEQSYRTTVEIMTLANKVLGYCQAEGLVLAKPVVRHGKEPAVISFSSKTRLIEAIERQVQEWKDEGYGSIAIISKTPKDCTLIKKQLIKSGRISPVLLDEKEMEFIHDIVVIPSHLSKGLEFDGVIVAAYEDCFAQDDLDIKLLYVSMTRALHRLSLFSLEGMIPLLNSGQTPGAINE